MSELGISGYAPFSRVAQNILVLHRGEAGDQVTGLATDLDQRLRASRGFFEYTSV